MYHALEQYITLRRALGAKLPEPPRTLRRFIDFLKKQGATFITTELALRWAMQPQGVQRAHLGTAPEHGEEIRRMASGD